jgi:hypothetical protein
MLYFSAKFNDVRLAKYILSYRANVNTFFYGKTAIIGALKYSSIKVLRLLLRALGVDINVQNKAQESALWYTIKYSIWRTLLDVVIVFPAIRVDLRHKQGRTAL